MKLSFIDLQTQYKKIAEDIAQRTQKVLDHGQYIMGPEISELEEKLAQFVGAKHCIGLSSGTDALLVALMALNIKAGDEVIVPDFTFIAPAEMVALIGAKPVFADIDPRTYNLDANLLEQLITPKTKAIIPVSLYGQCPDIDAINAVAAKHNIPVIEDAAQSFGATYKGKHSCNLTTIGCTSFFPSKPLGCYGDGGACFTNDDELAEKMRSILSHGQEGRYHHTMLGISGRLDTLQAAILLAKLEIFPEEVKLRQQLAAKYTELLKYYVDTPYIDENNTSVYAQYTIGCDNREQVIQYLTDNGIPSAVHYPKPLHEQVVFEHLQAPECPNSRRASERVVSLPFSPYLKEEELELVAETVIKSINKD